MNKAIHPVSTPTLFVCSSCKTEMLVTSTVSGSSTADRVGIEVCSNCHPAYTGKAYVKRSGNRIEAFEARYRAGPKPATQG